jgi:hypothetical protein
MPVFFFIDPDVEEDPDVLGLDCVTLSYTFHKVDCIEDLPRLPGFENIQLQKAESLVQIPS